MFTGRNIHYTQHIVRPGNIHRLTVNRCLPSRIIYFRENNYTVFSGRSLINQTIRLIARQTNGRQRVLISFRHTLQFFLKLRIYYSGFRRKNIIQSINFLICIIHILHLIHKPGITVCIRIFHRNRLPLLSGREDKVFRVQHIQHTKFRSIHAVHFATGSSYFLIGRLHFRSNMMIDHFLITAQLGGMITTDTLMPVRCIILIKCIAGETYKVQYPII